MDSTNSQPLWKPKDSHETNVAKFTKYVNKKRGLNLNSYNDLYEWSTDPETLREFWRDAYQFLEIAPAGQQPRGETITTEHGGSMFPPPRFFPEETFNLAELLLRNQDDSQVAIHFFHEGMDNLEAVTWKALRERVRKAYNAMDSCGIGSGDRVAAVISNSVDAIVLCLATISLGAVWSSSSPDMGPRAIIDRYTQIKPKLVFADSGYIYANKRFDLSGNIKAWSKELAKTNENLSSVVVLPGWNSTISIDSLSRCMHWNAFVKLGGNKELVMKPFPFSHPAFILFSSGTTGPPKCIVHCAGGVALKVKTDSQIQHDVRKDDVVFQYTTTGWVMWVLNLINLSTASSMLLYDGSPFHPRPDILLKLAESVGVTVFGTSPRYLSELRDRGIHPRRDYKIHGIRIVTSTGSVLSDELYEWFYGGAFPDQTHLISMSGGTDIAGSFVGGTPLLPVYKGEVQVRALGMAVDIFDPVADKPTPVTEPECPGELVCTQPFPSQPLEFYGKAGLEKYNASYFQRFGNGVWCQGDFIQAYKKTGGIRMLGRSDGVLNPSGVRFGSAEIYAVTDRFDELEDSICVGQRRKGDLDERVLLFIRLKSNQKFTPDLVSRIKRAIREKYSAKHVPQFIFAVAAIPYTMNGKKCELNVKQIVSGVAAQVSGTVANPESLKGFEPYVRLRKDGTLGPRGQKL
ncbi:acetoacetyl-synthase [Dendryphion nanum]|uniref:Acetoacetyl-synthase n=1 Tax=Dendryphion nanum TaxID=256645 RepID=A0A9P9E731_9PLEO|nr:acetoacetyl-synthase [Dendryphion nanum]